MPNYITKNVNLYALILIQIRRYFLRLEAVNKSLIHIN